MQKKFRFIAEVEEELLNKEEIIVIFIKNLFTILVKKYRAKLSGN